MRAALPRVGCLLLLMLSAEVCAAQAVEFDGEWRQGSVIRGRVPAGAQVWFRGVELKLTAQGQFVFGLDRDEQAEVWFKVQLPGEAPQSERHSVAKRDYEIQRIDGLPPDKVEPPKWALPRIARDAQQLKAARSRNSDQSGFTQSFIWPTQGRVSGVFGSQRILNGTPKQPHNGVDVAVPEGTGVVAPADGVVSLAVKDMYYTGGTVVIDHGHGLSSVLIHLSKLLVEPGQTVRQGETVALSGMTGRATGPHLHWSMSWLGARVDPQAMTGAMPAAVPEKQP